jgi:hypothetical protein
MMKDIPITAAALLSCFIVGCSHKHPATMQSTMAPAPMAAPESRSADAMPMRAEYLRHDTNDLTRVSRALPGKTVDDQRDRLQEALGDIARILPVLAGPNPGGAIRTDLSTIESSRALLGTGAWNMSTEPATDDALRATYRALASIAQEPFYQTAKVSDDIDRLSSTLDELDSVRGPFHRLVAARAVGLTARISHQLSNVYVRSADETERQSMMAATTETSPATTQSESNH